MKHPSRKPEHPSVLNRGLYLWLTLLVQALLVLGLLLFLIRGDWENLFLTVVVIALTMLPAFLDQHYRIVVPPEFQFIAVVFVFLSLFLGSAADFYYKFWWWDIVLHIGSGFLLGVIGFIAVFVLNHTDRIPPGIRPVFLCVFAVTFAISLGVVWEIFEFAVDRFAPAINMQSNETGVNDTMHDLIVDTIGAAAVAIMGWAYLKTGRYSFVADGVRGFLERNPKLFRKAK
jgi:hypothetical protein